MISVCIYNTSGFILEYATGNAARKLLETYSGTDMIRINQQEYINELPKYPNAEEGPVYPAGYNIDGTPPIILSPEELFWQRILALPTGAEKKAAVIRMMKRRCRNYLEKYKDSNDTDFGDPEDLAFAIAKRDAFKLILQQANAATSEQEMRDAVDALKAEMQGA